MVFSNDDFKSAEWQKNSGNGTFLAKTMFANSNTLYRISFFDLNANGKLDMILSYAECAEYAEQTIVRINAHCDIILVKARYATGIYAFMMTSLDINGVRKPDIIHGAAYSFGLTSILTEGKSRSWIQKNRC